MEKALSNLSPPPSPAVFERRTRRRLSDSTPVSGGGVENKKKDAEEEEEAVVEEKIALLKKMVPGTAALGVDALFDETAAYILALQCQIKAMKVLSAFLERLEMEKNLTRFGG